VRIIKFMVKLGGILASPVAAHAQVVLAGQGVADRPRPDYDAVGDQFGSFRLFPSVTASVEATDNYLATDSNRRGDVWLSVRPEASLRSQWSRHRLDASLTSENAAQFGGSIGGVYDVSRATQLRADAAAGRYVESRSSLGSVQGAIRPVKFTAVHGGLGIAHQMGDLILNADGSYDRRAFSDTVLPGNVRFSQEFRDVRSLGIGGSARYDLRNGLGLIASARYSDDRYSFRPGSPGFINGTSLNRNSSGVSIQGGITLELTRLLYGTVQIGYINRNYRDVRLQNFSGLSFDGNLLWNVTGLTTLRLRASRSIEDTSSPQVAGNLRSDVRFYVDHELYRNIIVSGDLGYGRFRPNGIGFGGDEYTAGINARYLINRRFSVVGGARYSARSSDSSFLRYRATSVSVGLRVQF